MRATNTFNTLLVFLGLVLTVTTTAIPVSNDTGAISARAGKDYAAVQGDALTHWKRDAVTLFHGTCAEFVEDIKTKGLKAKAKPGNFSYKGGVYLTTDPNNALHYAKTYLRCHGAWAVIVYSFLPTRTFKKLKVHRLKSESEATKFLQDNQSIAAGHKSKELSATKKIVDSADVIVGTVPIPAIAAQHGMTNPFEEYVFLNSESLKPDWLKYVTKTVYKATKADYAPSIDFDSD